MSCLVQPAGNCQDQAQNESPFPEPVHGPFGDQENVTLTGV
jgi:hypothetical protein